MEEIYADVNSVDVNNRTPLSIACQFGRRHTAEQLITQGASVNHDSDPALTGAAFGGQLDIVRWLIEENGADINAVDVNSRTALSLACQFGHKQTAEELIGQGALINHDRDPALGGAASGGQLEIARWLLDEIGNDVNAVDVNGITALSLACQYGHRQRAEELIKHGASVNHDQDPALSSAVLGGQLGIMTWLIKEKGADINGVDSYGRTALAVACNHGHKQIAEELIKNGALVNHENDPSLSEAAFGGHTNIVTWLVDEMGADTNGFDANSRTALSIACQLGHRQTAEELIKHGGLVNHNRDPALNGAALGGQLDIVRWLIEENGADVNLPDVKGHTSLSYAHNKGYLEVCAVLTTHGATERDLEN